MKPRFERGDLYLLLTVIVWGNTFPTAKYVLGVIPPDIFASTRYLLAAFTLMGILIWREGLKLPQRRDLLPLLGFGFLGITLMQLVWSTALSLSTASKGSILIATSPIWALILNSLRGQRLSLPAWGGVVLSFGGVFLVINNSLTAITVGGGHILGDLMFLAVAFCWALYSVLSPPYLQRLGTLYVSGWSMLFGALLMTPVIAWRWNDAPWAAMQTSHWASFAYTVVLAGALGYLFWYEGIRRLGIARSVIYSYLIPVFAMISAVAFLGEHVSLVQLMGAGVVIAGLVLTRWTTPPPP
ncbi:MAG: DMT family transporter [Ferrovibrio sp.]|uniref:DMT family transporter n=1 Tax=Ferrovibrio sp. TaxID=1917215 RepID=UPI0026386FA1|nr:DMT family transporter [Ferrovibrio sp.]MCW0232365.1 DMT family transporter [Ferrovibrio sp.]